MVLSRRLSLRLATSLFFIFSNSAECFSLSSSHFCALYTGSDVCGEGYRTQHNAPHTFGNEILFGYEGT